MTRWDPLVAKMVDGIDKTILVLLQWFFRLVRSGAGHAVLSADGVVRGLPEAAVRMVWCEFAPATGALPLRRHSQTSGFQQVMTAWSIPPTYSGYRICNPAARIFPRPIA